MMNKEASVETVQENDLACFDPGLLFPKLRFGIYRFTFKVQGENRLSGNLGSAWRGVLGPTLQQFYCPLDGEKLCSSCRISGTCVYHFFYEAKGTVPGFASPPRPYIIRPLSQKKDILQMEIILICLNHIQTVQVLSVWKEVSSLGLGRQRIYINLKSVEQVQPDTRRQQIMDTDGIFTLKHTSWLLKDYLDFDADPPPVPWCIKKISPLRLRRKGKYLNHSDWSLAFKSLARNLALLSMLSSWDNLTREKYQQLSDFFNNHGRSEDADSWQDWHRFSSRQNKKIPMGGVLGISLVIPPRGLEQPWWQWWKTAEFFHLGKGTTMGQGRIEVS